MQQVCIQKSIVIKMQNQFSIESNQQKTRFSELLNKQKLLCTYSVQAIDICVSGQCQALNPLICSLQACNCIEDHLKCSFKRLTQLKKQFVDQSNELKEVEKTIYDFSDKLIDQISDARDNLISKINQRQWMGLQERNQKVKGICLKANNIQAMTGQDIALVLEQKKRFDQKNELKQFYLQVKDIASTFEQKIKDSFQLIEEKLQPNLASIEATQLKEKRVHWSKELKGPNIIIKGPLLKRDTSYNNKIALLWPSIPKSGGNVIKWQMRIPKSAKKHWVAMGICLRQKIKLHNFDFIKYARYQSDHGCYVMSNTGHSWADNNPEQNEMMCSLTINNNEIITMTLNVEAQTLHYRNESTEKQYTQKIKYDMEKNQGDEMHICALLEGMKDEVELLEVQNEKTVWKIQ